MSLAAAPLHIHRAAAAGESDFSSRRRRALQEVDKELSRRNFKTALSLVKRLKNKPYGLRAFGSVKQVSRNALSLDALVNQDGTDLSSLQPLLDSIMESIQRCLRFSSLEMMSTNDLESINNDEDSEASYEDDHYMIVQHEAGHFLVGYLLGVLPRYYEVPSLEAPRCDNSATGRVAFVGSKFFEEAGTTKMLIKKMKNSRAYHQTTRDNILFKNLNNFMCVTLGGLVAEHMLYGYSEGLHADVDKLDSVLRWLGYPETEANLKMRWATLNTILLLRRHNKARTQLAEAMAKGKSIGSCMEAIENAIFREEI